MNNLIGSLVALCTGILSFWHFPGVLANSDNHNDDHHDTKLELRINGKDNPKGIINFSDLKPGDNDTVTTDLWVNTDAKIYLHLTDLSPSQGTQTEPEILEEAVIGAKDDLQDYLTYDLSVGSQVIIPNSSGVLLPAAVSCWIPLGDISANQHLSLSQSFHFNPAVTNWAQGDKLTFTEEFYAAASTAPVPDTGSGRVWDPAAKHCVIKPAPTPTTKPTPTPTRKPTPTPKKDDDHHDRR